MTRRLQICAVAVALGGCDTVFGLQRTGNAAVDAARPDVPTNCAPGEHDEDGDGVPDRCDTCPYVADLGGDADEDGVGDACDPESEGENRQLAFFGFDAIPSELKLLSEGTAASWSISKDRFVITGAAGGDYLARLDVLRQGVIVRTRVTFSSSRDPNSTRSVGLWADIDVDSIHQAYPQGFVFEQVDVVDKQFAHIFNVGVGTSDATESAPFHFEVGRTYDLTLSCSKYVPTTCVGIGSTSGQANYSTTIQADVGRVGAVGLRVHGDVVAEFEWLAVYSEHTDTTP